MNWIEIIIKILNFINEVILPFFAGVFGGIGDWNVVAW